jgi:hypothetical protein
MVYAHVNDKVKAFLQPFVESGQVVSPEDIKALFEKLRGDAMLSRMLLAVRRQPKRRGWRWRWRR